jgi:transposase
VWLEPGWGAFAYSLYGSLHKALNLQDQGGRNTHTTHLDWLEGRRRRAWELKQQGWRQQDIAAALGVTPGAVSQWLRRAREGVVEALRRQRAKGPTPKLTPEQLKRLPDLLAPGAEAYGYRGQVWTTKRVAQVIWRTFGVRYHPAHVSRLLRAVRLSVQQPIERATQRDEQAIKRWHDEQWPALKKRPSKKRGPSSG